MDKQQDISILVVEDEPEFASMVSDILSKAGYEIEIAGTGEKALNRLNHYGIDLVLLDHRLPDMSSRDVVKALGSRIGELPVIIITAYGDEYLARELFKLGIADYLPKGSDVDYIGLLPRVVRSALEKYELLANERRYREKLRRDENNFRQIFEAIPDPTLLFEYTGDGRFILTSVNRACMESEKERYVALIGKELKELDNLLPEVHEIVSKTCETGKKQHKDFQITEAQDHVTSWYACDCVKYMKNNVMLILRDITYQKLTEKTYLHSQEVLEYEIANHVAELRKREELYRELVERAGVAVIITDREGNLQYFNDTFTLLFGYADRELRHRTISDLVHPDSLDRVFNILGRHSSSQPAPNRFEFKAVREDGGPIFVEAHTSGVADESDTDHFRFYLWDITDRKRSESKLQESEAKFRNVIENSNDAMYVLHDGKLDLMNRRFFELFGFTTEDLQQSNFNFLDYVDERGRNLIEQRIRMQEQDEPLSPVFEFTAFRMDGKPVEVETNVSRIPYQNGWAVLGSIRDVTEKNVSTRR